MLPRRSSLWLCLVLATAAAAPPALAQNRGVPQSGFPSWQERMLQVLYNRVRAAPTADPKACPESTVRNPLVWSYNLNRSARFHSSNLNQTGCFQHNSPCLLHADLSSRYLPDGACDGAAACACTNTAACNSACTAAECTQTFSRVALFGTSGSGEIIAGGQSTPRSAVGAWMNSAGHCSIILGSSSQVGNGQYGTTWTGNFGNGATPSGTLIAGGHEVGSGNTQFTNATAQNVAFRVNYFDAAGAPQEATVNVGGTCATMRLERGAATNATYLATFSFAETGCRRYRFSFRNASGATVVLPEQGSYGVGGSLASCADWDATVPAACGATLVGPTVATAAAAAPSTVTGNSTTLSVLGADDNGEGNLVYTWSWTGPTGVTFSQNGTNAAKSATATFTRSGSYVFTASIQDGSGLVATSSVNVTVSAVPTSVTMNPTSATVVVNNTRQFTASARDQFNLAISPQPSFEWTVSGGGAVSDGGLFTAGGATGGPFTVTADAGTTAGTASVTVGAGTVPTISQAAAATPNPVTSTTATVSALGADDGTEANLTYTWSSSPATVVFSPNGTNAAKSATATFPGPGTFSITVTIRDAGNQSRTSTVSVTVNSTLTTIAVSPATASVATGGTQAFTASASDQFGTTLAAQPSITWTVSNGGTIDGNGLFSAGGVAGGPHTVTASSGGRSGTAQVTVTGGTGPTIATAAAAAPSPVTGTTTALSVLGADDGAESSLSYTWSSTGPAAVSFSANGTNAAKNTTATFSAVGAYTITATVTDSGGQTVTSAVSVTVTPTLTTIAVTPASATVGVSGTRQFSADARDQFGASIAAQPTITWSVGGGGSISSSGLFTAGTSVGGPHTVTAASGGKSGTASVSVSAGGAPTVATAAAATPNPVNGTTTALSVLGADDGPEASLSYQWSSTRPASVSFSANGSNAAKNTTATFSRAGSYAFTATITDPGGQTATGNVAVTVAQTLTSFVVTPASSTVVVNGTQSFAASARDQFAAVITPSPAVTWTVSDGGTIDGNGLFTAGSSVSGPHTVTASSGGKTGTAQVSVGTGAAPTVATAAAATPNPTGGSTTSLTVLGADDGAEGNLTYSWSGAGPAPVTFSANGTNAAKATVATFTAAGAYGIDVTIRDVGGLTAQSQVTVTVSQTLTAIAVTPATASVPASGTQTFTAAATDQFGAAVLPAPVFTWTVGDGGTIDGSGLFTAGSLAGGPFAITAAAQGRTGAASVTVLAAPADVTPPAVALTSPSSGTVVSGVVPVSATASDDAGISLVELLLDGGVIGSDATPPYGFAWDTSGLADGPVALVGRATDLAGNVAETAPLLVTVANAAPDGGDRTPPKVAVVSPDQGGNISGQVIFVAEASDESGVAYVLFELDGAEIGRATSSPWQVTYDTLGLPPGEHDLYAVAADSAGNVARSERVLVRNTDRGEVVASCGCGGAGGVGAWSFLLAVLTLPLRRRRR